MKISRAGAVVLVINISLGAMEYKPLNKASHNASFDQKTKKEKSAETLQAFKKAYRDKFRHVWNNVEGNKKSYAEELSTTWQNLAIVNKSFNQYVFMLMQESYQETLKQFYPNDPLLDVNNKFRLKEQADREVRNYIENDTFAGCCWLKCAGV